MKQIPLGTSKSKIKGKIALVSDTDYALLNKYNWFAVSCKGRWYARTWVKLPEGGRKQVYMHRMLKSGGLKVDHKDGDGLNNQRNNLRYATTAQNSWNCKMRSHNTTDYRCVYLIDGGRYYLATFEHEGKDVYCGRYKTAEEAARAYDKKVVGYRGKFAKTNFPQKKAA